MDVDTTPKKKTVYCQALQHVIEFYLPKLRVTEENKDATPTIHLKVPQILCILQENDLINMCMQDPSSSRMLDVLFKRLWELVHTREMESMWAGFVLLDEVFKYCNHEKLMAHFETWMKDFQDAISLKKKMDKGTALPRGLGAWCTLAARASEWADLKRACSVHVPFITVALLAPLATESEYSNETKIACIEHLCTLLDSMNSSVKPQVPKIEAACLPFLFHHNFELRNAASQLFGFLPKCFSSSSMHLTPFIEKTIEHAHLFLDVIFAGLEDKSRAKSTTNHTQLPPIAGMKAENLLDGFKGICSCLSTLFSTKFTYPSELPLENVLKLITRIFYVNYGMTNAGTTTSEPDQLSPAERLALIPFVHITALELLDTLVVNLQRHLLAHTRSILRIITQIHTRTLTRITSAQKLAYIVLGHTVELVCGAGLWGICEDALLAKLLSDTSPPHKVTQKSILDVKLAGKSRHNNNAGGKKKKKKNGVDSGADDYEGDSDVTMEVKYKALKALYSILLHTGSHIPPQQRTKIDRTIVAHLLKVTSDRSTAYKVGLFRCLKAAVLRPVPSCPPILVFSLRLFNFGLVDKCSKVVRICKEGAAICENQVHPYVPTLPSNYLPPVPLPQTSTTPSIPTPVTPVTPSPAVSEIANTPTPSTTNRKRKEPEPVVEEEEDKIEEEVADKSMVDAEEEESEEVKESKEVLPSGSKNEVVVESSSDEEDEVVINYTKIQQTVVTTESHGTKSEVETISSTSFTAITDDGDDDDDLDIAIDDAPPDSDEDVSDLE